MSTKRVVIPLNDVSGNQDALHRFTRKQPDQDRLDALMMKPPWNRLNSHDFIRSGLSSGYQSGHLYGFSWGFIHEQADHEKGAWLWEFCFPDLLSLFFDQQLTATHLHSIAFCRLSEELPEHLSVKLDRMWHPQRWHIFPTGIIGAFTLVSPFQAEAQARTFLQYFLQSDFINNFIDAALFYGADTELLPGLTANGGLH